jgi:nucleoside-diphosphate-sugar epimerase
MYGRPDGAMNEDTPMNPCSKKGALRVKTAELRLDADRRGDVRVAIARGSDFFGSDLPYSMFSDRFYERVFAGKKGECTGDPDMVHSYTYAPDVAAGLATLGDSANAREAMGKVWMLPTERAESTNALGRRLGKALGVPAEFKRVPMFVLRGLGVFSPMLREIAEMAYQWEAPYVIDDSRFRKTFGASPTSIDAQVAQTARVALKKFGHLRERSTRAGEPATTA